MHITTHREYTPNTKKLFLYSQITIPPQIFSGKIFPVSALAFFHKIHILSRKREGLPTCSFPNFSLFCKKTHFF